MIDKCQLNTLAQTTCDLELAELVAKLVFKIWSRSSPSDLVLSDFISFVSNIISLASPNVSPSVLLTSLLYVKRLKDSTKSQIHLGYRCEFRIWLTALMLADTFLNDNAFNTYSWNQISGVSVSECCRMKKEFLESIGYTLHVTEGEYGNWLILLKQYFSRPNNNYGQDQHYDHNQVVPVQSVQNSSSKKSIQNIISCHQMIGIQ